MTAHHVAIGRTGGITTVMTRDTADNRLVYRDIMHSAAVQSLLDTNAQMRLQGYNKKAPGRLTHNIPMTEWVNWKADYWAQASGVMSWQEFVRRKLESGDYSKFSCIRESYKLRKGD